MAIPEIPDSKTEDNFTNDYEVARQALKNLGYLDNEIARVLRELKDENLSLEALIKESLKRLI